MAMLCVGGGRRLAVLLSQNDRYRVLLRVTDGGIVDVERLNPAKYASTDLHERHDDPLGPWRYANTFARSELFKTRSAARAIEELRMEQRSSKDLTMKDIVDEYNRLTGRGIKEFKSKAAGLEAIEKASKMKNAEATAEASAPNGNGSANNEEGSMEAATQAAGGGKKAPRVPAKKAPADKGSGKKKAGGEAKAEKKVSGKKATAEPKKARKTNGEAKERRSGDEGRRITDGKPRGGIGTLIREMIGKGKSNEEIVDAVLAKFPGAKTNNANVSWYRSDMKKGGK